MDVEKWKHEKMKENIDSYSSAITVRSPKYQPKAKIAKYIFIVCFINYFI